MLSTSTADVARTVSRSFAGGSVEAQTERGVAHGVARRITVGALLQMCVCVAALAVMWRDADATALLVWLVVAIGIAGGRGLHTIHRQRSDDYLTAPRREILRISLGSLCSGLALAAAYWLFVADADIPRQLAFALVVVASCSGAAASMAGLSQPYLAYALPPMLTTCLGLIGAGIAHGSGVAFVCGFLGLLYQCIAWFLFLGLGQQMREALRLQFLNERLVSELEHRNLSLEEERDQLRIAALTDAVTGLPNRRRLEAVIARDWARCRRERKPLSCLLIELQHRDSGSGHPGDTAAELQLRALASRLARACRRETDFLARYHASSFAVLLPSTDMAGASHYAGLLLAELMPPAQGDGGERGERLPVSIGLGAADPPSGEHWRQLTRDASTALERARVLGPGRIETTVHSGFTTRTESVA